jgi:chemotaxis signal transduction protein
MPSSVRARRFANRSIEATRTAIAFEIRRQWFAFGIETLEKVILLESVYPDPLAAGVYLTRYQEQEIVTIDLAFLLFQDLWRNLEIDRPSYLAIIRGEMAIALAIDSSPSLRRVAESAFFPLPAPTPETASFHPFAIQFLQPSDSPPIFLLDSQRLQERGYREFFPGVC